MLSALEGFHCIIISTIIIIFNCTVLFLVDIGSSVKSSLRLSSIKLSSLNKKPQTESTFLSVCAVLRMADFRRTRMSVWISYCFKKYFSCFGIGPNAPITTGITLTFASEHPHILDISTFSSAYFVIFSTSLSAIFLSAGIATSIMRHSPFLTSCTIIPGLQCSIILSVWISKSHRIFSLPASFKTFCGMWFYHSSKA